MEFESELGAAIGPFLLVLLIGGLIVLGIMMFRNKQK
jgi:hypothetical protein